MFKLKVRQKMVIHRPSLDGRLRDLQFATHN